jgi:hypothetical protein
VVRSHCGSFDVCLTSPRIEYSGVFHVLRVSKTLKENSPSSFFINKFDETEKVINYRPLNAFFRYFNEREENKIAQQSFCFYGA